MFLFQSIKCKRIFDITYQQRFFLTQSPDDLNKWETWFPQQTFQHSKIILKFECWEIIQPAMYFNIISEMNKWMYIVNQCFGAVQLTKMLNKLLQD